MASRKLADDTDEIDVSVLEGGNRMLAFLKTSHTLDTFPKLGKDSSFKQRLNNFAKMFSLFYCEVHSLQGLGPTRGRGLCLEVICVY